MTDSRTYQYVNYEAYSKPMSEYKKMTKDKLLLVIRGLKVHYARTRNICETLRLELDHLKRLNELKEEKILYYENKYSTKTSNYMIRKKVGNGKHTKFAE